MLGHEAYRKQCPCGVCDRFTWNDSTEAQDLYSITKITLEFCSSMKKILV